MREKIQSTICEYIDWKESYFYRQLIVRHAEDAQKWESGDVISEDDYDLMSKLMKNFKMKKSVKQAEELFKMAPSMTRKCHNSIKMVYKEVL